MGSMGVKPPTSPIDNTVVDAMVQQMLNQHSTLTWLDHPKPIWGKAQERAAIIVAFAALLPTFLAVPIINWQTRAITP